MGFFKRKKPATSNVSVQTARTSQEGGLQITPLQPTDFRLYDALRGSVPIIDAAINKIIRLTVGFNLSCGDKQAEEKLRRFCRDIKVGASGQGLAVFMSRYLESLLTYGNSVGEIVLSPEGSSIAALYNAPLDGLEIREGKSVLDAQICIRKGLQSIPVPRPQLIMFTPLNPPAGSVLGCSLLQGLPFVSSVLLKIYESIGNNFKRIANLRYAVTYRPQQGADRAAAQEIAQSIAREWSSVMSMGKGGQIKDFVAVGDVDIKVIGADNQIIDTQVPVRQMLEEIVAKLGLPPFLLGLSWSTTERMSRQQADLLTSELEYYRSLLTPVIERICSMYLKLEGYSCSPVVEWNNITLMDETELAGARLTSARAAKLEAELEGGKR